MPTYDFKCPECNHAFEVTRRLGQTDGVVCPVCETPAKRVFAPVGVVFKGSGFHNTDYRPKKIEKSEKSTTPKADSCAGKDSAACASCPSKAE